MAVTGNAASYARGRAELSPRDMEHLKLPDDQFKVYLSVYQASTETKAVDMGRSVRHYR